jgi:hypothetical protein
MFFLSIGAIYGGILLVIYPDGSFFEMPLEMLSETPFPDYIIPGILLLLFLGLFPFFAFICLILKPDWPWFNHFNVYQHHHFSWSFALYASIFFVLWMNFQFMFLGCGHIIQTIYSFLGIGMIMIALVPSVIRYYTTKEP